MKSLSKEVIRQIEILISTIESRNKIADEVKKRIGVAKQLHNQATTYMETVVENMNFWKKENICGIVYT